MMEPRPALNLSSEMQGAYALAANEACGPGAHRAGLYAILPMIQGAALRDFAYELEGWVDGPEPIPDLPARLSSK
jgi:hypothetical protein